MIIKVIFQNPAKEITIIVVTSIINTF
jgi:hypothetical protein